MSVIEKLLYAQKSPYRTLPRFRLDWSSAQSCLSKSSCHCQLPIYIARLFLFYFIFLCHQDNININIWKVLVLLWESFVPMSVCLIQCGQLKSSEGLWSPWSFQALQQWSVFRAVAFSQPRGTGTQAFCPPWRERSYGTWEVNDKYSSDGGGGVIETFRLEKSMHHHHAYVCEEIFPQPIRDTAHAVKL